MLGAQQTIPFPVRKSRRQLIKDGSKQIDTDLETLSLNEVDKPTRARKSANESLQESPCRLKVKANSQRKLKAITKDENTPTKSPTKGVDRSDTVLRSPRKRLSPKADRTFNVLGSPPKQHKEEINPEDTLKLTSPLRLATQEGTCYQKVKQALHTAMPERLVCREKETACIQKFLSDHLYCKVSGSLYVSGAPGTGKTAVLTYLIDELRKKDAFSLIFVNCMSLKNSYTIYKKIYVELTGKEPSFKTSGEAVRCIEKEITLKGNMILMILDEIDQLDSKNQEVLYTMFEWPTLTNSRLVLIGIANSLDLTDRILPRLQSRPQSRPQLLNFPPYGREQIVSILQERLLEVQTGGVIIMEPSAVQFCARKVAAMAGDMRRALDICRRAVDIVEANVRSQRILKPADCNSPRKATQPVPQKITVAHIMNVVTEVYGSKVVTSSSQHQNFPLQQKLVVCTVLLMIKLTKAKEVLLGKLHDVYKKVCKTREVTEVDQSEFLGLCTLLETRCILGLKKNKNSRLIKVALKLDEKEVEFALQDKLLISSILNDGIPK